MKQTAPDRPRILGLSMVKNEQDIIEPFVRHNMRFLDAFIVLDNGSVDDTHRILVALMRELDGLVVTVCSAFGYTQAERMSRLLRTVQAAYFADYIIFLDADEFIGCADRPTFEQHLLQIPPGGYGLVRWRNFVLSPSDPDKSHRDPPRSMPFRRSEERPTRDNIVLRLDGRYAHDLIIAQGNHAVQSSAGRVLPAVPLHGLTLDHFPLRSAEQLIAKSVVGWMAYLAKDPDAARKGDGSHWRHNFDQVVSGRAVSYEQLCALSMLYDQPHRTIDWAADIVRDDPPEYTRVYSVGEPADPLVLVSRSWQASLASPGTFIERVKRPGGTPGVSLSETAFDANWHWDNLFADLAPFIYLAEKFTVSSVLDVGCGVGLYLRLFRERGARVAFGVDGIPPEATVLAGHEYRAVDLTAPLSLGQRFDVVLCLEVAEHLPDTAADVLMDSIAGHAGGLVVFSAAEVNQPGHGHINCRPIGDWLDRWRSRGWVPDLSETLALRALATLPWFKRNIVVLRHDPRASSDEAIAELVRIGSMSFRWSHANTGVREEVLLDEMPAPPYGYPGFAL